MLNAFCLPGGRPEGGAEVKLVGIDGKRILLDGGADPDRGHDQQGGQGKPRVHSGSRLARIADPQWPSIGPASAPIPPEDRIPTLGAAKEAAGGGQPRRRRAAASTAAPRPRIASDAGSGTAAAIVKNA